MAIVYMSVSSWHNQCTRIIGKVVFSGMPKLYKYSVSLQIEIYQGFVYLNLSA